MTNRRRFLAMLAAMLAASCSPSDEQQAEALRRFMQERIVDRNSRSVPQPNDEQRKSFGRFVADYQLILDFNRTMSDTIGPRMREAMARGRFTRLEELIDRRADIVAGVETMQTMKSTLDRSLSEAEAKRATFRQTAPLKAAYDQVFDRLIAAPGKAFQEALPIAEAGLRQALEMSEFLAANRQGFSFSGNTAQTSNPRLLAEFNRRAQQLQQAHGQLNDALRRVQQAAGM